MHMGIVAMLVALSFSGVGMAAGVGQADNAKQSSDQTSKANNKKKGTTTLQTIMVTAYVPRETNAAAKMPVPLIETPQSVTVIPRAQMDLLDWQNLDQVVRYTAGVVGGIFGPDPRYDWLNQRGFNPTVYINGLQAPIGSVQSTGIDLFGFQTVEILKGPSSALYGSAPPGGIVDMTSRRPEGIFDGEVQLQVGSFDNKQAAIDVTGPLDQQGNFLGRITALGYDRGTQRYGVDTNRYYIAPAFTWLASPNTKFTFLSYFQRDDVYGDGDGFLPIYGVLLPNPLGKVPTSTNLGDTQYNRFNRHQYGVGYEFDHVFNDTWQFKQNVMYFSDITDILQVYGAGLATNADGMPTDYRTVNRNNFPFDENIHALEMDSRLYGKFGSGDVTQNVLVGLDFRHYTDDAEFGFAAAPPIDLFNPVYGVPITTPPLSFPYLQQIQKQTGLYAEDVIKIAPWVLTVGGREDDLNTSNFGKGTTNHQFTYHVGLNYLMKDGLAPYVSYATSFQPTSGADFQGAAFKPTSGNQVEAGLKFQPSSVPPGTHIFATLAAYELKQNNVLTPDPNHLFFQVQTGQVEVKGLELEGVMRVGDHWSFNAALTTMNPVVTKSNGPDLGKQLPVTPKHMVSALVDYTQQTGRLAGLGASLGFRYIGPSYGDAANLYRSPGATIWDATIHYGLGDHWLMDLSLSNLFNKTYVAQCSSVSACYYGVKRVVNFTITRLL
ncbi:MAG: TonB-dependent siderophore receptor [Rhodanobacteraceae bacterium]|nr:MAG: TonB-dependent siderophore receptor [Rhodanobacteraceae bacterium]